jgi:hypothetical protein
VTHSSEPVTSSKGGSVMEDLINIFINPALVFEHQKHKGFVVPALVQMVLLLVIAFAMNNLMAPFLDADMATTIARVQASAAAKGTTVPPEQIAGMQKGAQWSLYGVAVLGPWLTAVGIGVVVWLCAKFVSAKMSVTQGMMIASWSAMPTILGLLALAIFGLFADPQTVRGTGDGQLGAARFFDPATMNPLFMEILKRIEVFYFWEIALTGIGIAVVAGVARSSGFIAAAIRWALVAVMMGSCASMGS